jgi:hypothetical protein
MEDGGVTLNTDATAVAAPTTSTHTTDSLPMSKAGRWEAKLSQLRAYKEVHGHCNVPRTSKKNPEYNALGEWCHFQRRMRNKLVSSKNSTMTMERLQALTELGFEWSRRSKAKLDGEPAGQKPKRQRVAEMKESRDEPTNDETEPPKMKRNKTSSDYPSNKARLKEDIWLQHLEKLSEYKGRFGHCNIPRKWEENGPLGEWCHFQR